MVELRRTQHPEVDAQRPRNEIGIGIASRTAVNRTGVHAGPAAEALEHVAVRGVGQPFRTAVIDQNDVNPFPRGRTAVERGVARDGLSGARTRQQARENRQRLHVGDHLLDSHDGDMQVGERGAQIGVALVGADGQSPRGGHGEVDARHRDVGPEELRPQGPAGRVGQVGGIAVARFGAHLALEKSPDLLAPHGNRRQDDVAGRPVQQLHDPLPEVALHGIYAPFVQVRRQPALLREHRLALDEVRPPVLADQLPDDLVHLGGVLRPMDRHAVGRGVALELAEVVPQAAQGVAFDLRRPAPQLLPLGNRHHHPVALLAHGIQRLVVPGHAFGVGDEPFRGFGMGAHNFELRISTI